MNYNDFHYNYLNIILPNKDKHLRNGQSLIIYLAEISPKLYTEITATEFDCFYNDNKIFYTLMWLQNKWE